MASKQKNSKPQPPQHIKTALKCLDEFFRTGAEEIDLVDAARGELAEELNQVQHGQNALDILADLLEWSTNIGGFEAKCWKRARKIMDDYRDARDGNTRHQK